MMVEISMKSFVNLLFIAYPKAVIKANSNVKKGNVCLLDEKDWAYNWLVGQGLIHSEGNILVLELETEIKKQLVDKKYE